MEVKSAVAKKFVGAAEQKQYTHLDLQFAQLKHSQCTAGILPGGVPRPPVAVATGVRDSPVRRRCPACALLRYGASCLPHLHKLW